MAVRRVSQETQLNLFEGMLYLSQSDAAEAVEVSVRQIQYWESQGLLHPELPVQGRNRKYTRRDLVELRFIKALVEDLGFTVPSLQAKLPLLQAPYDYDPGDLFWDLRSQRWKSRTDLATEHLAGVREKLEPLVSQALERLLPGDSRRAASALLDLVREALEGRADPPRRTPPRRRRA